MTLSLVSPINNFLPRVTINGDDNNNILNGNFLNNIMDGKGGDDWIYGGDGNDTLTGGLGSDYIAGGIGDDTLYSQGEDNLSGGSGYDVFVIQYSLNVSNETLTTILDFDPNYDIILVSDVSQNMMRTVAGLSAAESQSPMEFVQEGYAISVTPLGNGISTVTIGSAL